MTDDAIDITINGTSHAILCGFCKTPITFLGEPDMDSRDAGCAACRNWDNVQKVARIAIEYAKDEGQLMLNQAAQDAARKSKLMTFSGQTEHDERHRFIVGDLKI
ncbi:hypothetical protein [Paracoccus sp. (in: a-proteobacteria)]|uniref:hypothetical protein n=1 Tax=Paracoccus sp. TaxID=267 RepID=UPI00396C6FAE